MSHFTIIVSAKIFQFPIGRCADRFFALGNTGVGTRKSKIFEGKPKNLASLCYQKDKIGSPLLGFKKLSIGKDTIGIAQTFNVRIRTLHIISMCMSKTKMDRFQVKVKLVLDWLFWLFGQNLAMCRSWPTNMPATMLRQPKE